MDSTNLETPAVRDMLMALFKLPPEELHATMMSWLRGEDDRRRALAVAVADRGGQDVADLLIAEALGTSGCQADRVAALQAIERIGRPLRQEQLMTLIPLVVRPDCPVRDSIVQLLNWNLSVSDARPPASHGTPVEGAGLQE